MPKIRRQTVQTLLAFLFFFLESMSSGAQAEVNVVASIVPLHSLAAAITSGAGEAVLLLPAGSSPHNHALRPSQLRQLRQADLVIWIGPQLESSLARPLSQLRNRQQLLTLGESEKLSLLSLRRGGVWQKETHSGHSHDSDSSLDPHLWLDPDNAIAIGLILADHLSRLDPGQAPVFRKNAADLRSSILAAESRLRQSLAHQQDFTYLVFHDAYQYFEKHFGLHPLGSISIDPDHQPGARRIARLRQTIISRNASCIASEPQFPPRLAATLAEETGTRLVQLDPIGSNLPPGPEAYVALLHNLAEVLQACRLQSNH